MKRILLLVVVAAAMAMQSTGAGAVTSDHDVYLENGQSATLDGMGQGVNPLYYDQDPTGAIGIGGDEVCTKDPHTYCDYIWLSLTNPVPAEDADGRLSRPLSISLTPTVTAPEAGSSNVPAADYDIELYASNADKELIGAPVAVSNGTPLLSSDTSTESVSAPVQTTREAGTTYMMLKVIYWAAPVQYTAQVNF